MNDFFDVAIIGAGLGGACAALALRRAGFSVALLEAGEPARHKVCGEFLSPESRATWKRAGVLDAMQNAGALEVKSARVLTSRRSGRAMPLPEPGLALSRRALDALLWEAAKAQGVEAFAHERVSQLQREGAAFRVCSSTKEIHARWVIVASGRTGRLEIEGREARASSTKPNRRFLGLKTHLRGADVAAGEVQLFPFRGGYCGLAQVESDRANACLLIDYEVAANRAPAVLWDDLRRENRALGAATDGATPVFNWLATGNVSFGVFRPDSDGVLRVGDAAGYIHPLTGDGMAMAARSGELAAQAIACAHSWKSPEAAAPLYAQLWHREFDVRLGFAARLQPLLTVPALTTLALGAFDFAPGVADFAVRRTRGY